MQNPITDAFLLATLDFSLDCIIVIACSYFALLQIFLATEEPAHYYHSCGYGRYLRLSV